MEIIQLGPKGCFGKETADQAIQQGNARVSNGNQQDIGELATQTSPLSSRKSRVTESTEAHIQVYKAMVNNISPSTIAGDQPRLPTTVPAGFIYFSRRRAKWTLDIKNQVKHKARNKAFDRHYKAICLAGKSNGIEALK
ncbi:hypothetical protein R3P38DRAFT_2800080 [Favolaschia claudopus]|uniref:Uncharacterized protein n=1 Tax=Favolaschia claudopus TaxID=2862362 RepID=A0AAV9ZZ18_9AGAR